MKAIFMKNMRGIVLLLLSLLCIPGSGQIYKYIGLEDGLSSRNVYAVQQSNNGFMWFLTDNGIDRYDGTNMSTYTFQIAGKNFTEYSTCRLVHDAVEDNLWVVTVLGRVVKYDRRNNRFEVVYSPQINASKADISEGAVSPIDANGNIWIFVGDEAFCYNVRKGEGTPLRITSENADLDFSAAIALDSTTLYVGTKRNVYLGRVEGDGITLEVIPALQPNRINVNTFYYNTKYRTLLIGTEDAGIIAYREQTGAVSHHQEVLPDVRVTRILPFNEDEVLFSTNAACVYRMKMDDLIPAPYLQADYTTDYRMNTDNVADMCIDMDGQLWMCSYPKGLTICNESYPNFNWICRSKVSSNTLIDNGIDCILEDGQHDLWYATDNGISLYDTHAKHWYTMLSVEDESPNPNHYFLAMCEVTPGTVLLGGYASGIYIVDKATRNIRFVRPRMMAPEKYIQTMYLDTSDGSVWMGGENQLFNVSYNGNVKVNYAEVFGGINCITLKDRDNLWIGTKDGLYIFNKTTHEKRRVELPLERFKVNTLFQDADGTIYIGTHHDGLIVYNEEQNYYYRYNIRNSALTNNCMKCIVNAGNGSLYISSDGGLVRFNKNTKRITTWTSDQGLEGMNFSIRSGIRTHRNTMMFGGDYGVIEIHEGASLPHIYKSSLILADLYIGNRRVAPDDEDSPLVEAIDDTKSLKLANSQRNAGIKVKNVNHIYPSDCIISWTTDRNLKKAVWHELNEDNFITLNDLKMGKHVLTIRSTSKESGGILDERVLGVTITPPFYLSFLGILIELGILLVAVMLIMKYTESSNAMHISDEKVRFFINTAHDLRTPITLIKAPLQELSESSSLGESEREAIDLALRNTNTLAEMTDKVMRYEIESIEKGVLRVECHEAISYMSKQIERWKMLAEIKHQKIDFIHPEEPFDIWIDVRKLNSIIQNLLSNAIKYSDEGKTIVLSLYCNGEIWGFHVSDKGIGIHEHEQKLLFKQLFRGANAVNAKILGSGIGLLSIGRYVKDMKGRIEVTSQVNKGSDFHVAFPLGKKHYSESNTIFIETPGEADKEQLNMQIDSQDAVDNADTRTRLLVVEDNPELLAYLSRIFSKDYRVYTATNGAEALAKVPLVQPAIVLSDVMMPEMRGDDLCVAIKENPELSHIAVVLISALSDQQSIVKGLKVKADAYVTKPFDMQVLQLTIQNLIESRKQLQERLVALDNFNENLTDATTEYDLKLLAEMRDIISKNLDSPDFTVDVLAYELRVSRTTLYNKIKGLMGHTPSDLIRECRISRAKTLLREHRHTVAEVADLVGFSDQKYFREVFKKATGMTPSEYAKSREG